MSLQVLFGSELCNASEDELILKRQAINCSWTIDTRDLDSVCHVMYYQCTYCRLL